MNKIDVIFIEIKRLLDTKEWNYIDSFTRHFSHNGYDISIHIKPPKNGNRKSSPKRGQSEIKGH